MCVGDSEHALAWQSIPYWLPLAIIPLPPIVSATLCTLDSCQSFTFCTLVSCKSFTFCKSHRTCTSVPAASTSLSTFGGVMPLLELTLLIVAWQASVTSSMLVLIPAYLLLLPLSTVSRLTLLVGPPYLVWAICGWADLCILFKVALLHCLPWLGDWLLKHWSCTYSYRKLLFSSQHFSLVLKYFQISANFTIFCLQVCLTLYCLANYVTSIFNTEATCCVINVNSTQ